MVDTLPQSPSPVTQSSSSSTASHRRASSSCADTVPDLRESVAEGIRASDLLAVLQDRLSKDLDAWLPDKDATEVAADMIEFLVSCMIKRHRQGHDVLLLQPFAASQTAAAPCATLHLA